MTITTKTTPDQEEFTFIFYMADSKTGSPSKIIHEYV